MNHVSTKAFQLAIGATHSAKSKLLNRVSVHEQFHGETVWKGEVLVFELIDHPEATRCYAWEVDGEVIAVLRMLGVDVPIVSPAPAPIPHPVHSCAEELKILTDSYTAQLDIFRSTCRSTSRWNPNNSHC